MRRGAFPLREQSASGASHCPRPYWHSKALSKGHITAPKTGRSRSGLKRRLASSAFRKFTSWTTPSVHKRIADVSGARGAPPRVLRLPRRGKGRGGYIAPRASIDTCDWNVDGGVRGVDSANGSRTYILFVNSRGRARPPHVRQRLRERLGRLFRRPRHRSPLPSGTS